MINDIDISSCLLFNDPIFIKGMGNIYSLTINEIRDMKFSRYYDFLKVILIESEDIENFIGMIEHPFVFLSEVSFYDSEVKEILSNGLNRLFRQSVDLQQGIFLLDNGCIDKDNFRALTDVIKMQNCISIHNNNKKTKKRSAEKQKYFERLKKVKEEKPQLNSEPEILDIISSVCARHQSINLQNVGEFSIYQLTDQFKRLNAIDEYYISIDSMIAGCSDIKLIHWSDKIK